MPGVSDDQISHFTNQINQVIVLDGEPVDGNRDDENAPQVAIQSVLELARLEEDRLKEHVESRLAAISQELGRGEIIIANESPDAFGATSGVPDNMLKAHDQGRSFLAKRRLHELNYNLKVEWREWVYGGIFAETNYPVPMSRRLVQQQISRAQNYFFATDPWFTAGPEGRSDEEIAREVDRFAKYKGRKIRIKSALCEAIRQSFIRGEGILKTAFVDEQDVYETIAEIAIGPTGEPVLAEDGDYIYKTDGTKPETTLEPVIDPATNQAAIDPNTGEPAMQEVETGNRVLVRDGITPVPKDVVYVSRKITRQVPLRRGAVVDILNGLDFLCPLNAPSVQEADFVAHIYERPALHIAQQVLSAATPDRKELVLRILQELTGASKKSATGQDMHRPEIGETHAEGEAAGGDATIEPRVKIAECYVRYDVNGDGVEENLFVLYDTENQRLVFYDYLANITPDGRRPFHIVRANPVDNRWYGLSQMEVFEDQQKLVDLFLNRVVKASSDQATVKFWRPERTREGEANPDLIYNNGMTLTPKDNYRAEDILETVVIYEPRIQELMSVIEFAQQNTLNMSGVTGANDADAAGLDTQKTATGVRNIDRTGQELFGPFLQALEEGLASSIQAWIALELSHLDGAEVYEYFEGDTRLLGEMTPEKARNLSIDVRLELTRYRNEQQDVQMMQSIGVVQQFFALTPELQVQLAPMFRQLLKLREVQDADRILQPQTPEQWIANQQMMGGVMPGANMQGTATPPTPANPVSPVGAAMPGASPPLT